jgi:hypothetical protein
LSFLFSFFLLLSSVPAGHLDVIFFKTVSPPFYYHTTIKIGIFLIRSSYVYSL